MTERNDQQEIRRRRRQELLDQGLDVYPARSHPTATLGDLRDRWKPDQTVTVAGRVKAIRLQGGSAFLDLEDGTGHLQLFLQRQRLGQAFRLATDYLDLGDIIEATGLTFVTKTGESSINVETFSWLAKALRPLPSAWHGLADIETRYRYRELDTLVHPEVKQIFLTRSKILSVVRQFLVDREFVEVETPMLHPIPGGATARPFVTHHQALDVDLFLRVAPELYLKRLMVGGFRRVFEIGRNFRNEGIDRDHNPEFTMMECYAAYTDYEWMMNFTEDLVRSVATSIHPGVTFTWNDHSFDLSKPFVHKTYDQVLQEHAGVSLSDRPAITTAGKELIKKGLLSKQADFGKTVDELFKTHARPKLIDPILIYDYPAELSPLAKKKIDQPEIVEMFQLVMGGTELAKAFSELNDPIDQRERFEAQEELRRTGDQEAQRIDETYLRSLEYGLPPTSGLGLGLDRLTALLTGQKTLKDVILFPTLKPEQP